MLLPVRSLQRRMASPFWTGYALTLTETFGATVLAIPIAVAGPGPLPGLVVLIALGIINILTLAAYAEAFTRDGRVRYGEVFLGSVVESYLGKPVSVASRFLMAALMMLALFAFYIGVSTTLGDELPVSPILIAALMFSAALVFIFQEALTSVISASLLIGAVNIALILAIAALALPKLHPAYLAFADTPFYGHHHFYIRVVGLLVGVVLAGYFGHISVGTCAATVLKRDPSGRTLLWGCVAAQATVIVLYVIWVIAVNGTVPRRALMGDVTTALVPLDSVTGGGVRVLGLVFVVLAMGIASIHYSIGLRNMMREWLPREGRIYAGRERMRAVVAVIPVALVFLVVEWSLWRGGFSFSAVLAYYGVTVVLILAGFLPLFLLVASRRKGDRVPGVSVGVLGNRFVLIALYVFFLAIVLVHGLFIWVNPEERVTAVAVGLLVVGITVWILRSGELKPRLDVEIRAAADRQRIDLSALRSGHPLEAEWTVVRGGQEMCPIVAANTQIDATGLDAVVCSASSDGAAQMQVWVHADTGDGETTGLPAMVDILESGSGRRVTVDPGSDPCIVPIHTDCVQTRISFIAVVQSANALVGRNQ